MGTIIMINSDKYLKFTYVNSKLDLYNPHSVLKTHLTV